MESLEKFLKSPITVLVYFAILLVLVIVILWMCALISAWKSEGLIGSGVTDKIFTSGATMRRLGTEFSQPSQGEYTTPMLADVKELLPGVVPSREDLVSERAEPNFWEIGSELEAYREHAASGYRQDVMEKPREYMADGSVASRVQEELLRQQLWR